MSTNCRLIIYECFVLLLLYDIYHYSNLLCKLCIRSGVGINIHPRFSIMNELLLLMKAYDVEINQKQSRDKNKKTMDSRYQFTIGQTCRQRTYVNKSSFRFKHNFLPNIGVYSVSDTQLADPMLAKSKNNEQKMIYAKARELICIIDSKYAANDHWVVQVHCMDATSRIGSHVDKHDITFQYGVTLGEYEGGNLLTWDKSGLVTEINVHNQVVKLDGRLQHSVTPIISGKRYSLYYYKSYDPIIITPTPILELAEIVQF